MTEPVERRQRTRPTLARRALGVAEALGLKVEDVSPGVVVLSRRRNVEVQQVPAGAVVARPGRARVQELGDGAAVVASRSDMQVQQVPGGAVVARPGRARVQELGDGAAVVASRSDMQVQQVPGGAVVARAKRVSVVEAGPGAALLIDNTLLRRHRHEHEKALAAHLLLSMLMDVFDCYGVNVVLDVGANKGQYGRALRRAGYRGHIVSFEPVAREFEQLRRQAAKDGNWSAHQIALGREDGQIEMNVVPGTLSSALPPSDFGAQRYGKLASADVQVVPVHRLDGIFDELLANVPGARAYLKLDTQGFDLEAFAGLGDRVRDVVAMQSEVALLRIYDGMPRLPDSLAVYESAGFEVAGLYPVTRERSTARVLEFDCLMVRADTVATS